MGRRSRGAEEQGSADCPVAKCVTVHPKLDSDIDSDLGHMPDLLLGAMTADVRHPTSDRSNYTILWHCLSLFELTHSPFRVTYANFAGHIKTNCTPPRAAHKSD